MAGAVTATPAPPSSRFPGLVGVLALVLLAGLAALGPARAATPAATTVGPAESLALRLLAQARGQVEANQPARALDLLERLGGVRAAPPRLLAQGLLLGAYLRAQTGQAEAAARDFSSAAGSVDLPAAERRQARIAAAGLWINLDRPAEAVAVLDPTADTAEEQGLLGQAYYRVGDYAAAVPHLERAIQRQVTTGSGARDLRLLLLNAHQQRRDWSKAIATLETLLAEAPDQADWWRLLGDLHLQLGRSEAAAAAWQTALGTDPGGNGFGDPRLTRNLARLYLGLELPIKALAVLPPVRPDSAAQDLELRARALELARQPEQALAVWDRLAGTGNPAHRLARARLLSRLQRWAAADVAWRALLDGPGLGADDRLQAALSAYHARGAEAAAGLLREVDPSTAAGATARQWLEYLRQLERARPGG